MDKSNKVVKYCWKVIYVKFNFINFNEAVKNEL